MTPHKLHISCSIPKKELSFFSAGTIRILLELKRTLLRLWKRVIKKFLYAQSKDDYCNIICFHLAQLKHPAVHARYGYVVLFIVQMMFIVQIAP